MSAVDTRNLGRDSLFLMAGLKTDGSDAEQRIKVRNLSAGGMMAEGDLKLARGTRVFINLRNIGWISGTVAWVQDARSGIAFAEEIDPKLARAPVKSENDSDTPRFVRPAGIAPPISQRDQSGLRKI